MKPPVFTTARKLANKAEAYFRYIEGDYHLDTGSGKEQKVYTRNPEPATFTGLTLFIGFNSRQELEDYEQNGEFGYIIGRSRLRIETLYEKKLHQQSPAGAIFALKNWGWKDKPDDRRLDETPVARLEIQIVDSGIPIAKTEEKVVL